MVIVGDRDYFDFLWLSGCRSAARWGGLMRMVTKQQRFHCVKLCRRKKIRSMGEKRIESVIGDLSGLVVL